MAFDQTSLRSRRWWRPLSPRQVDLSIAVLIVAAIGSGLASWATGDRWNGLLTLLHGVSGLTLTLLIPAKLTGSVRTGMRRGRASRWASILFGLVVVAALALGVSHATGIWFGVGTWSALWTHELLGFATLPFLLWHMWSRPRAARITDLDRRAALRLGAIGTVGLGAWFAQRTIGGAVGLAGGSRRATGSHEVASHDPARMPRVIWLDDRRPAETSAESWRLHIAGERVEVASLAAAAGPVEAVLDCTGGWYSEQVWDVVPLSSLIASPVGRSVVVRSVTGYARRFPITELESLYLAVGYEGEKLRSGHGAPVRLVAPGRRGPEWVKWVTEIEVDDKPGWFQAPLPLT